MTDVGIRRKHTKEIGGAIEVPVITCSVAPVIEELWA